MQRCCDWVLMMKEEKREAMSQDESGGRCEDERVILMWIDSG